MKLPIIYKRPPGRGRIPYKFTTALCLLSLLYFLVALRVDYFLFMLIMYGIIEILFHPTSIELDNEQLVIIRIFAAGLIKERTVIQRRDIACVNSIGRVSPKEEVKAGMKFWFGSGDNMLDLYEIDYNDEKGIRKNTKVNLHDDEIDMIGLSD